MICPLLMQARASIPLREGVADWGVLPSGAEVEGFVEQQREPMFHDPSQAPGVACIGSRCAWWKHSTEDRDKGCCAQAPTWSFPDPALEGAK